MKILYIDICARTVNPTNSLIPALLRLSADLVCYGPGFVDESELKNGIAEFVGRHDEFDFYVMTWFSPELRDNDIRSYYRYACPNYPTALLRTFASDVTAFLKRSTVPKILFLTGRDIYGISEQNAELIAEINGYLVSWAVGFSKPLSELDVFTSEEFFARKKGRVFGRWHDLVAKYEHKFINFAHFVAETEFAWTSLDNRRDKVVVPGQIYVRRKAARRKLLELGILARSGGFKRLMSIMDHIGLRPHARPLIQSLYNRTFTRSIETARYAYTDGYGYDRPIRKFFEIPALGTVLLCTPCAGFSDLGFVNRENAVVVAPEAVGDAVAWLRESPADAQRIAEAGRQLIWDKHSLHARAEQFKACLKSISSQRYLRSRWNKGNFIVDETPAAERVRAAVSAQANVIP